MLEKLRKNKVKLEILSDTKVNRSNIDFAMPVNTRQ